MSIILPDNRSLALPTRRSVLLGLVASALAAPAIVRASSIMPVRRVLIPEPVLITAARRPYAGYVQRLMCDSLAAGLLRGDVTTNINGQVPTLNEAERMVRGALQNGWLSAERSAQIRLLIADGRIGSIVEPRSRPGYTRATADDFDAPGGSRERRRLRIRRE